MNVASSNFSCTIDSVGNMSKLMMDELSLNMMRGQTPAFCLQILSAILNVIFGLLTFLVIRKCKILCTDTQILVMQSNLSVCLASISFACAAVVHLK